MAQFIRAFRRSPLSPARARARAQAIKRKIQAPVPFLAVRTFRCRWGYSSVSISSELLQFPASVSFFWLELEFANSP